MLGRPVLGPDRAGWAGGLGYSFVWTPLRVHPKNFKQYYVNLALFSYLFIVH